MSSLQALTFRAMGTACSIAACAPGVRPDEIDRALAAARREVERCERVLSRFETESDLSRLNRGAGEWVTVDARLIEALAKALDARRLTRGRFDPTILPALEATGYDRSFDQIEERPARPATGWCAHARIELDPEHLRARLERGAAVDVGGIGKGFAARRALEALRHACPLATGAIADLGGDIAVDGSPPDAPTWRIEIADPRAPGRRAGTLQLSRGGVATSGRDTRRFGPARSLHHLIDPRTGCSATDGPLAVTVVAATTDDAECYATALAISEIDDARALVQDRADVSALWIPQSGDPVVIGRLPLLRAPLTRRLVITTPRGSITCT